MDRKETGSVSDYDFRDIARELGFTLVARVETGPLTCTVLVMLWEHQEGQEGVPHTGYLRFTPGRPGKLYGPMIDKPGRMVWCDEPVETVADARQILSLYRAWGRVTCIVR